MKLTVKNVGSNYLAQIVTITNLSKHPNADRLSLTTINHNTIVIGASIKLGDLVVVFPIECAINKSFLSATNSFSDPLLNKDQTKKGFFNDKGRVRAVKLRGQPSEGYIVPLVNVVEWINSQFRGTDVNITPFPVDVEFDTIGLESGELLLCEKYVPFQQAKGPANTSKKDKKVRHNRIVDGQFHFHVETSHLKKNIHQINPDDMISITYKLHGTSLVASRLLINRKLNWYEKLLKKLGVKVQDKEYGLVYSSRKVIKNQYEDSKKPNHWYKEDIWGEAAKKLEPSLLDGITIYAEIVGFTPGGKTIQKGYDYGCSPGEFEVYVYRITYTNASGDVLEFTTNQIKSYCNKFGLKMVPLFFYGPANLYGADYGNGTPAVELFQNDLLQKLTDTYLEKGCSMCSNKVPAEGVVVTVERNEFTAYKLKSFAFNERESKELDNGEIDLETAGESGIIGSNLTEELK